jgi:hypothetical protein
MAANVTVEAPRTGKGKRLAAYALAYRKKRLLVRDGGADPSNMASPPFARVH